MLLTAAAAALLQRTSALTVSTAVVIALHYADQYNCIHIEYIVVQQIAEMCMLTVKRDNNKQCCAKRTYALYIEALQYTTSSS